MRLAVAALVAILGLFAVAETASAASRTINYDVSRTSGTRADFDEFHYTVHAILEDARGWSLAGAIRFKHVSRGEQFTVRLTSPRVLGSYSGCSAYYSCRVGRLVMINDDRWRLATSTYRNRPLHHYRQLVVNHEVGHALGFGHRDCGRRGWRAPVMQQQSKDLGGCVANPWPLPSERAALGRRLGVSPRPLPPGIEVGDRIGPIDLGIDREDVLGRLGRPDSEERSGSRRLLRYNTDDLGVALEDGLVSEVWTWSRAYRTAARIGVGSTRAAVRRSVPNAVCGERACVVEGRNVVMRFTLADGVVKRVRVSRVE